MYVTNIAKRFA